MYRYKYEKWKRKYLQLVADIGEVRVNQLGGKQKYFYHGSSNEIKGDYLEPRPSKVIDDEKAVFATNSKMVALYFIPNHSDLDFIMGHHML